MPVQQTNIGWTDYSGNHWKGCAKISEGCKHCWSAGMADRLNRTPEPWTINNLPANLSVYDEDISAALADIPSAWCFFPSSTDPYLPALPAQAVEEYHDAIRANDHLCYQVLTKWGPELDRSLQNARIDAYEPRRMHPDWPPHVMLGVTVESQLRTYRLDWLREQHASVKFVSFEPLLEPIGTVDLEGIDWAIIGGESGLDRRDMNPVWARDLIRECWSQATRVFFKQHSDRHPERRTTIDLGQGKRHVREFPKVPSSVPNAPMRFNHEQATLTETAL